MSTTDEILVDVKGLKKKFCKDFTRSLRYGMQDVFKSSFGFSPNSELRKDEFLALNDINFQLRRGECIGLIGHNGAGKSTLLKILNGIIKPDEGSVTMKGRIGALIELGAGFNPILTGRENIYNNGAVLGFTKEEIDAKLEEIIEFSELEEFIDSPVRNYSSGMKVRLGFAVASNMDPDVLIIDEVLAVGDTGFKLKCFKKLDEILQNASVIFVSHNMPQVMRLANQVLLLNQGQVAFNGQQVGKGIELYYGKFSFSESIKVYSDGQSRIEALDIVTKNGRNPELIEHLDDLTLDLDLWIDPQHPKPVISIVFFDKELKPAGTVVETLTNTKTGAIKCEIKMPRVNLSTGKYSLTVNIQGNEQLSASLKEEGVARITVHGDELRWSPIIFESSHEILNSED
jgi:lipopolysaccharide transport system ATP-binding protein